MVVVLSVLAAGRAEFPDDQQCPEDCDCHYFRVNYVTDCSESNFTEIPYDELSPNVYILDLNGRYTCVHTWAYQHFFPLSGNEISEVTRFPDDIKIRRLQLAENKLTKVTADMFAGLKLILDIDLSSNRITTVDPDTFRYLIFT